jgi:hypothetical protein
MRIRTTPLDVNQVIDDTTLLNLFKAHLRIDEGVDGDDDNLIAAYLRAAVSNVESLLDAFIFSGTFVVTNRIDKGNDRLEILPIFLNNGIPLFTNLSLSIDGVQVVDPQSLIIVKGNAFYIDFSDLEDAKEYQVSFTIPSQIQDNPAAALRSDAVTAAVMLVGAMLYENREDKTDRWVTVARRLLQPYMLRT